jgi:hypothetical protein
MKSNKPTRRRKSSNHVRGGLCNPAQNGCDLFRRSAELAAVSCFVNLDGRGESHGNFDAKSSTPRI